MLDKSEWQKYKELVIHAWFRNFRMGWVAHELSNFMCRDLEPDDLEQMGAKSFAELRTHARVYVAKHWPQTNKRLWAHRLEGRYQGWGEAEFAAKMGRPTNSIWQSHSIRNSNIERGKRHYAEKRYRAKSMGKAARREKERDTRVGKNLLKNKPTHVK